MKCLPCPSDVEYTALRAFCRHSLLALALVLVPLAAGAQAPSGDSAAPEPAKQAAPADPFGRSTPAGTIDGFIKAIAAQDYERASEYLDLSHIRPGRRTAAGPELAQDLQRALDRGGRILSDLRLSDDPAGRLDDNLDPALERVGSIGIGARESALLLRRVGRGDDEHWVISSETLEAASALSARGDVGVLAGAWLPAAFSTTMIAGVPASHWLTLLGITIVVFILIWASLHYFLFVLGRIGWKERQIYRFLGAIHLPLALLLTLAVAGLLAPALGVSIVARQTYGWLSAVIGPFMLGWLSLRLIDVVSGRVLDRFGHRSRATATSIVRFAGRLAKAAVIAIVGMAILDAFGFDVTGVVAALGIGGLALALGAQKTVENLVASVSILSDRPLRVGDFCKIGDALGTVEDIGMRSTRIRTLDRTIVTIPNSNLVDSQIENFAGRDRFLFHPTLYLPTDTPPEKLRPLLAALRTALDGDDRLLGRMARVRMLLPTNDRLPIEVFGYVLAADFDAFLEVQEEVLFKLLDVVADNGLVLAPPALDLRRNE